MEELVTLAQAKQHLKMPTGPAASEADLQRKLNAAHDVVEDYLKQRRSDGDTWAAEVDAWTDDTAPPRVLEAICRMFADLTSDRGDDKTRHREPGQLPEEVVILLYRLRDPAIA